MDKRLQRRVGQDIATRIEIADKAVEAYEAGFSGKDHEKAKKLDDISCDFHGLDDSTFDALGQFRELIPGYEHSFSIEDMPTFIGDILELYTTDHGEYEI